MARVSPGSRLQRGPQQLDVPLAPLDEALAVAVAVIMPHDDARITQHLCAGRPADDLMHARPARIANAHRCATAAAGHTA